VRQIASPLGAFHPANALTYVSLLASVAAIACATGGSEPAAGALIAVSVIADTFDGRFARLFSRDDAELAVGVQLDSLSDAIAFGIAPAICATLLLREQSAWIPSLGILWWIAAGAYAAAAITRLAFYNVTCVSSAGFVGLPVPVAALIWATALLFTPGAVASIALFASTAAAMVLPVRIPRPTGLGLAAFACWPVAVVTLSVTFWLRGGS
jgi:CDP-diacylglycerol--serine O-phosphatidyltransferase